MDISPEYVKMCSKATEIQNHYLDTGDYYYVLPSKAIRLVKWADQKRVSGVEIKENGKAKTHQITGSIWLPRQDQLQDICETLTGNKWTPYFALTMLLDFANEQEHPASTMEQLWLAFVMAEIYEKRWDGESWQPDGTRRL